jgi:hypothetical protein
MTALLFTYLVYGALMTGKWLERGILKERVDKMILATVGWPYYIFKRGWKG